MNNFSPQESASQVPPPCFIKFRVTDLEHFQTLARSFEILKQEKLKLFAMLFGDSVEQEDGVHEQVLQKLADVLFDLLDEQALSHFWWPSKQENEDYWQRWYAAPIPQRFTDPTLEIPWDFASMIDSLLNGEYELISCRLLTPGTAVLEFSPFSFPYGGTECMKALIEAFDFQVLGEDNGTGYVSAKNLPDESRKSDFND